jgi:hypothetical protein
MRICKVPFTPEVLVSLINNDFWNDKRIIKGIPEDSEVMRIEQDTEKNVLYAVIRSKYFYDVSESGGIPIKFVTYKDKRMPKNIFPCFCRNSLR